MEGNAAHALKNMATNQSPNFRGPEYYQNLNTTFNTPGPNYNAPNMQGSFNTNLIPPAQPAANVGPTLNSQILNGNGQMPQLPPPAVTQNPQQFVQAIPGAPLQMAGVGAGVGAQEKSLTAAQKRLMELSGQLTGQSAEQKRLEELNNIPGLNKQITDLTNELNTKRAAFDQEANRISGNAGTQEGLIGRTSRLRREEAIELGGKSAALMALQGNLQGAREEVDRTLKFEFDPIKQELENTRMFIDMNYKNLDRADKKAAEEATAAWEEVAYPPSPWASRVWAPPAGSPPPSASA